MLRLSPIWETARPLVLAPRSEAIKMRREEGWEELPARVALREIEWAQRTGSSQLRRLVADSLMSPFDLRELQDHEFLDVVRTCIRHGEMVVLRQSDTQGRTVSETLELRRLVASIERQGRERLSYRGGQYKLVTGDGLSKVPGRDCYEVVSQAEARSLLAGMAKELPVSGELLGKASEKIGKDWRAPFSQPEGLVLLRRIPVAASVQKYDRPAITPSEMRTLVETATLEIHVVDLKTCPEIGCMAQD